MKDENTILKLENLKLKSDIHEQYKSIRVLSFLSVLEFVVILCLMIY